MRHPSVRRCAYNMIEVLVALIVVGIITTSMFAFVNDYHQRYRVTVARADLNRLAEAIQLAEQRTGKRIVEVSKPGVGITTALSPYLMELREVDPWGNRFDADTWSPVTTGVPYVVDPSMGRVLCAGPDGSFQSVRGQDPADTEDDIVVDFRKRPWLAYPLQGKVWLSSTDGAARHPITSEAFSCVTIGPDCAFFAGVRGGNTLVVGPVDERAASSMKAIGARPAAGFSGLIESVPVFYPTGTSVLVSSGGDLFRYDINLDQIIRLTTAGFFGIGDPVTGSSTRVIFSNGRTTSYTFTSASQPTRSLVISIDGKVAFPRFGDSQAGLFVVSAGGGDVKMIKRATEPERYLPVFWLDADTLVYRSAAAPIFFFRMRQDGSYDIALHRKPVGAEPRAPSLSDSGSHLLFYVNDTNGAVLKTDGSGYIKEDQQQFVPFSYSSGLRTAIPSVWSRDSKLAFVCSSSGQILQVPVDPNYPGYNNVQLMASDRNQEAGDGFDPIAYAFNSTETLIALLTRKSALHEAGVYVLPALRSTGAFTPVQIDTPGADDLPLVRWVDQQ